MAQIGIPYNPLLGTVQCWMQQPITIQRKITKPLACRTIAQVPWPLRLRRKVDRQKKTNMVFLVFVAQRKNISKIAIHSQHATETYCRTLWLSSSSSLLWTHLFIHMRPAQTCKPFFFVVVFFLLRLCFVPSFVDGRCLGFFWVRKLYLLLSLMLANGLASTRHQYNGNWRLTKPNFWPALIECVARHVQHAINFFFLLTWNRDRAKIEFRWMPDEYTRSGHSRENHDDKSYINLAAR